MERAADLEEDKNQPSSYSGHLPYEGGQSLMLMMNDDKQTNQTSAMILVVFVYGLSTGRMSICLIYQKNVILQ